LFIHVTVEPAEILMVVGLIAPLMIVAVTVVGAGDVDEWLHAIVLANNTNPTANFIPRDIL